MAIIGIEIIFYGAEHGHNRREVFAAGASAASDDVGASLHSQMRPRGEGVRRWWIMSIAAAEEGGRIGIGDRLYFLGYADAVPYEILALGQMVTVTEVRPDGEYAVFRIDDWGFVIEGEGETVFAEEVLRVPLPPVPIDRLPPFSV